MNHSLEESDINLPVISSTDQWGMAQISLTRRNTGLYDSQSTSNFIWQRDLLSPKNSPNITWLPRPWAKHSNLQRGITSLAGSSRAPQAPTRKTWRYSRFPTPINCAWGIVGTAKAAVGSENPLPLRTEWTKVQVFNLKKFARPDQSLWTELLNLFNLAGQLLGPDTDGQDHSVITWAEKSREDEGHTAGLLYVV